jgi:hypothetical protein
MSTLALEGDHFTEAVAGEGGKVLIKKTILYIYIIYRSRPAYISLTSHGKTPQIIPLVPFP